MSNAAVMVAIQMQFSGAFAVFVFLVIARIRGGDPMFQTPRRQYGSLLFCVGMFFWDFWWLLRWVLMLMGDLEASNVFVINVHFAFVAASIAGAGLAVFLSDIIRPAFGRGSLAAAVIITVSPFAFGYMVGI